VKSKTYMITNEVTRQQVFSALDNPGQYEVTIKEIGKSKYRSNLQNASIHLYCTMLANAYNSAGLDKAVVLSGQISIPWTMQSIKDDQWRIIQQALGLPKSTTKLAPEKVTEIYEALNRHSCFMYGIEIPFPSEHSMSQNALLQIG